MSAVYAVVTFCGRGSVTFWDMEHEAREYLALLNTTGCGRQCSHVHKLILLGQVIA